MIRELASEGKGIVVICADFAELETVCTRVVALHEGRVSGELSGDEITEDALIRLAYRMSTTPEAAAGSTSGGS